MFRKTALLAIFLSLPFISFTSASPQTSAPPQASLPHLDAATLDRYAGQYRSADDPDIVYSIFRDGDHLTIESARSPRVTLTTESPTILASKESHLHLEFTMDA